MRAWFFLSLLFVPFVSANQKFVPPLENIIAVELEFTCERPYVATVRFYNRINESLRLQLSDVDPAGYWNSYNFKIFTKNDLASRDRINTFHYENRVLEDISVVLPAGGVLQSIINLDEQYHIPKEGFNRIWYTSYWGGVEFADGSIRSISVDSNFMNFEDYCTREPHQ